ncbi:MAG: hypothetical protein L3J56_00485 [Bacteroidales bacterium]|nr:hypothetical protein [Bacteroidales bacterium]
MDTVLFEKDVEKKVKQLFRADDYHFELVEISVPNKLTHNDRFELEKDSYYYLASTLLDIPVTVSLYLSSENNFISTSKTDWEFDNSLRLERFRNYLHVRSENSTTAFPFKLKFLKVTPYRL